MMRNKIFLTFIGFFLIVGYLVFASSGVYGVKHWRLKSDSLLILKSGEYLAKGNVRVYMEDMMLRCQRLFFNNQNERFRAEGGVFAVRQGSKLWCSRMYTGKTTNEIVLDGNVKIDSEDYRVQASKAFFYRDREMVYIPSYPKVTELSTRPFKNAVVGRELFYFVQKEKGYIEGDVNAIVYSNNGEKTRITGKKLNFYPGGKFEMEGDVNVVQKDLTLSGDRGEYFATSEISIMYGNVVARTKDSVLRCGYLKSFLKVRRHYAQGSPRLIRFEKGKKGIVTLDLTADEIEIYDSEKKLIARGNVRLVRSGGGEDAVLTSDMLEYYQERNLTVAIGNVKVDRKNMTVYGDKLFYDHEKDTVEVEGNARAERVEGNKKDVIWGKKIVYNAQTGRVVVLGAYGEMNEK